MTEDRLREIERNIETVNERGIDTHVWVETTNRRIDAQGDMIEQYEQRLRDLEDAFETLVGPAGRIQALEERCKIQEATARIQALEGGRPLTEAESSERRDRWHRTRDAMLAKFAMFNCDNPLSLENLFEQAERIADRAHGPLEAPKPSERALAMQERGAQALDRLYREQVDALVKAAQDALMYLPSAQLYALQAALKPFEAGRG